MKTLVFTLAATIALAFTFPKAKPTTYTIDTEKSTITWKAKKVTGEHTGNVKFKEGALTVEGKTFKSGNFTVDMTTITDTDLTGNGNKNLVNHLKSDDFFGVEQYPTATFEITKVTPLKKDNYQVNGNLSMKGKTQPLTFNATVKTQGNSLVAVAKGIRVDRTKYDIKYRSLAFFSDIGDKAIEDEFELSISLVGQK